MYVVLPKKPINQFNLVQRSREQALRAYSPNIYIMCLLEIEDQTCTLRVPVTSLCIFPRLGVAQLWSFKLNISTFMFLSLHLLAG